MITAVDTNILIDILEPDPVHGPSSRDALKRCLREGAVVACDVVWAETAVAYAENQQALVDAFGTLKIEFSAMGMEAALQAAQCWHAYLKHPGVRKRIAADFLIGGHARIQCDRLLTRDRGFYRDYFKGLTVLSPQMEM